MARGTRAKGCAVWDLNLLFFLSESQEGHTAAGPAHTAGALQAALALHKEEELIVRVQFV